MSLRLKIILFALALTLAAPATTWAEEPSVADLSAHDRAELGRLFAHAQQAFEQHEYPDAIRSLERAFEIFAEPNILYRIGDAYERQGELGQAVKYYTRYMQAATDATDLPLVHRHIAELKRYIETDAPAAAPPQPAQAKSGVLFIDSTPPGAAVYVANEPAPRAVTPARIRVAPGKTAILIKAEGYHPIERDVPVEAGETLAMVYPLQKLSPKDAAPEVAQTNPWPWVIGAAGVASLATGAGFLIASNSATSQLETYDQQRLNAHQTGAPVPARPGDYDTLQSQEYYFSRTGWTLVGVGALGVGAAVAWLVLAGEDGPEVALVPGWGDISLMGRF